MSMNALPILLNIVLNASCTVVVPLITPLMALLMALPSSPSIVSAKLMIMPPVSASSVFI